MDRASFEGKSFGDKLASHQQKLPKIPIPGTQPGACKILDRFSQACSR